MSFNIPHLVSGLSDLSRFGTLCFPGLRKIRGEAPFFHQYDEFGEQSRLAGKRFWRVWRFGRVFASVWRARGARQVSWQAVLEGCAVRARFCVSLVTSGSRAPGLAGGFSGFGGRCSAPAGYWGTVWLGFAVESAPRMTLLHRTRLGARLAEHPTPHPDLESRPRRPLVKFLGVG